jgi:hypothetical protein
VGCTEHLDDEPRVRRVALDDQDADALLGHPKDQGNSRAA